MPLSITAFSSMCGVLRLMIYIHYLLKHFMPYLHSFSSMPVDPLWNVHRTSI